MKNVTEFPPNSRTGVPDHLRRVADDIESGEIPDECVVMITHDKSCPQAVDVWAWGITSSDSIHILGMLAKAASLVSGFNGAEEQ